jgi:hypothetical protein
MTTPITVDVTIGAVYGRMECHGFVTNQAHIAVDATAYPGI